VTPTLRVMGLSRVQPGDAVEYLSRSHGGYIQTTIKVVHTDGSVEVACKPGCRINASGNDVRKPVATVGHAEAPVHKRYNTGDEVMYFSASQKRWMDCKVTTVRDSDGAVQVSCKPGCWIAGGDSSSQLRSKKTNHEDAPQGNAQEGDESIAWELTEKDGFFMPGGMEDKVGSIDEAKRIVMANPSDYIGLSFPVGDQSMVFARKQGAGVMKMAGWKSMVLSCKPLDYKGQLFKDNYVNNAKFPGGLGNGKSQAESGHPPNTTISWRRPGRGEGLLDRPGIKLFGGISPNDLKQGAVGDCSLIASIACLCEFPEALRRLFNRTTLSASGRYDVTLWDWGTKDWITRSIDDRFATKTADDPEPLFVKSTEDTELYPMLIEKAVAIMAGGFDFMSSIMPPWALAVLTGNPDVWHFTSQNGKWTGSRPVYDGTSTYQSVKNVKENAWPDGSSGDSPKTDSQMWEFMRYWDEHNYMAVAGSAAQGKSDSSSHPCGIIYMHAYSVIDVKSNIAGSGINLAQVRNPHGAGGQEPDLPWKDNDPLWTSHREIAQACGILEHGHEADGLFWMQDRDFFGPNSTHYNSLYLVKASMNKRHPPNHKNDHNQH